ncbi:hypothetical protein THAOC_23476, partial [Thalassiosira oceanica]
MDNGMEKLGRGQRMRSKTKRAQESETQVTTRKAPKKAPKNAAATDIDYFLRSDMNESEPMEELDCSAGDSGKLTHQKALPSEEDGKVNAGEVDKVAGNMAPQKPAPSEENCAVAEKVDQEAFLAPRKEDC